MRRKLLVGAASLLGLILILVIAAFWYVRSGRLDALLQREIKSALKEVGVTAEIGRAHLDIRGYKVTLSDITFFSEKTGKKLASVGEIETDFSVIDYLRQKVEITRVVVTRPELYFEIDPHGRTSIDDLHAPPEHPEKKETIKFTNASVEIRDGTLRFVDKSRNLEGDIPSFHATFNSPGERSEGQTAHPLEFGFDKGASLTYEGRRIDDVSLRIKADLDETAATVREVLIGSPLGKVRAYGGVTQYKPFRYDLNAEADVFLAEVARVFIPSVGIAGRVKVSGSITGTRGDYKVAGNLSSDSLTAEGLQIARVQMKTDLSGNGPEYHATTDLSSGAIKGRGIEIGSLRLGPARVTGRNSDFDLTGAISLPSINSGKVAITGARGRLTADPSHVGLSDLSASLLGGTLSGSASVAVSSGASRLDVQFKSLDLNQAATLAKAKEVSVHGTLSGTARLAFPGFNYRAATGRVDATVDATVAPPNSEADSSPASGEFSLVATGRGFNIEKAIVHSAQSEVTASGSIGWDSVVALDVRFKSDDMGEVQNVLDSFGLIPEDVKDWHKVALSGEGSFVGRVQGKLTTPAVSGRLVLADIKADQYEVGSFEGDLTYEPSLVRVDKASVISPNGGRADFTLNAPIEKKDDISLSATIRNFDLPTLIHAAAPEFKDFVGNGQISGNIDLKGLPGPRTIDGSAEVTLSAAEFNVTSTDDESGPSKISVPEFKGQVTFSDSVLSVKDLNMKIGDSQVSGNGAFNLDTYAYSLTAEGKDLDLGELSQRLDSVKMSGRADLTVAGQGSWKEWSDINLNGTLQGRNVIIEGRDFGDAKLSASTANGILKVEATGRVLEESRTLAATVDLRERKTLPVNANIEFNDVDVGPYLALVSPELAQLTGRATGAIKLSGPLLNAEQSFSANGLQAVATLTKLELGGAISDRQSYTISNDAPIVITANSSEISVSPVTFTGEGTSVKIAGALSRVDASRSNLTVDGEVNLRFVSSFTETVFATGIAQVQASIEGSLESPRLLGVVNLKDLGLRVVNLPVAITHGNGQVRFTSDQALIENFLASTAGGGSLTLSGGAALSGLAPDRWRLEAEADQVAVEYPRDTQSVFDANVVLQGSRRVQGVLSGNIEVRRSAYTKQITLDELISNGGPFGPEFVDIGPGGGGSAPLPITADLRVTAENTLLVRNNLADALGSAYLNIRGPLSDPLVSGRVMLTQGTLQFRNDRYELSRGLITFTGKRRSEPVLDIVSEAEISGNRITVGFSGSLSKLKTTLRSDPELPEKDIVALILTGNVTGGRSDAAVVKQSGLGLAQSILAASLSEQIEKGTRLFGLSRFSIDPLWVGRGNDPTARVTVGRRITKDLTITYSQNLTSGSSGLDRVALVEYRISNRFSLVGIRNERGELGFDVRVRKRF